MSLTTNNIWERGHSTVQDTHSRASLISKYVQKSPGETLTIYQELTLNNSTLAIANKIAEFLKVDAVFKNDEAKWVSFETPNVLVIVSDEDRRDDSYDAPYDYRDYLEGSLMGTRVGVFGVTLVGDQNVLAALVGMIKETYHSERYARIKWWYDDGGRTNYKTTYLDNPGTVLRPEFYPGLEADPEEYIAEYLKSDSSVLLMWGPPGTGKTTLLRHMIYKHNLTASVVYDEKLMVKDTVFQSFLFDKKEDMLIIEDADVILSSREMADNRLMNRFLNVSDGLIKLPNKKLVFTTNITDFSKVDEALVRPGRCYDVLETRKLTVGEAQAAANAAGLRLPHENRDYTVAELFNSGGKRPGRRVGFRAA